MKTFYVRNKSYLNDGPIKAEDKKTALIRWCERRGEDESGVFYRYKEGSILISEVDEREELKNMVGKCFKGKCHFDLHIKLLKRVGDNFDTISIKRCEGYIAVERGHEDVGTFYDKMLNPSKNDRDNCDSLTGLKEIDDKEFFDFLSKSIKEIKEN